MIVALLTFGVLVFVALVVMAAMAVPVVVLIARGGAVGAPGPGTARAPRRHDGWWAGDTRSAWPDGRGDGDSQGGGDGQGDSSSCGSGGGASCGGGSSSCGGGGSGD
ncbi:hypothetical protein [Streptomyces stelliscabiei]|uniref:Putative membrane protein YgcG n=1 Tax=Streptomyces stelliscabiei TaxID=146820 RepID=A0A8I0TSQ7_9ACTN|nr:hypothetical protein [Streptomyces stelliscabiei]KND41961.1 hypothetical protein IQ64_26155 [Streptomyces stelliscabiei]MBE1598867.1 putative membrane protein YgcG [Streptomyces stelliscabiei]MDX2516348.1 hypothetical protein [Streptomyces stelliscabiei]